MEGFFDTEYFIEGYVNQKPHWRGRISVAIMNQQMVLQKWWQLQLANHRLGN